LSSESVYSERITILHKSTSNDVGDIKSEDSHPASMTGSNSYFLAFDAAFDRFVKHCSSYNPFSTHQNSRFGSQWYYRYYLPISSSAESLTESNDELNHTNDCKQRQSKVFNFIEFVTKLSSYHEDLVMPMDIMFVKFGVLATDIQWIWPFFDMFNIIMWNSLVCLTYRYFSFQGVIIIIMIGFFKLNYLYDPKVNMNFKLVLPLETTALVIVFCIYLSLHNLLQGKA
jgi:hypothetical protein